MIVASTPLVPSPRDVKPSASAAVSIDFSVTLSDTALPTGTSDEHKFRLKLEPGNDLRFDPENTKEVERPKNLSSKPTPFTFNGRVKGAANNLLSFNVALLDESNDTVASCLVGLLP